MGRRAIALLCVLVRVSSSARSPSDGHLAAPAAGSLESSEDTLCARCGGGSEVASWNCCRSGGSWEGTCKHLPSDGGEHTWIKGWYGCHPGGVEFHAKEPDWRRKAAAEDTFKRLVYNRVPKAGSSLMDNLIHKLSTRNNFKFVQDTDYLPNATSLAQRIRALPEGDVYINHAGFDATAPADVAFMNLVREPIDRAVSLFYYGVDSVTRPAERAEECLKNRQDAGACGCAGQEADYCVYSQLGNHCYDECGEGEAGTERYCQPFDDLDAGCATSHRTYSQTMFFCPPTKDRVDCDAHTAARTARERYVFVGMVEEFELSVLALEQLLPRWFAGAHEILAGLPDSAHRATKDNNNLTHTLGSSGTLSAGSRQIMAERADNQLAFYDTINASFWRTMAKLGLSDASVRRDWEFDA